MCGIAGVVRPRTTAPDREAVADMAAALAHRGPDAEGFHHGPCVSIGHRRLSVIDPEGGHQPMPNPAGDVVVATNAEIYNFEGLRQDLIADGHRFATRSDTEAVLHAYEAFGDGVLDRLTGLFALAIWDARAPGGGRLLLARDRMGQKPLYWAPLPDGGLAFASELTALLCHPDVACRIDASALRRYLLHEHIPSPRTALAGVHKLPPAHVLLWRAGEAPEIRRYWSARDAPEADPPDHGDPVAAAVALREGLTAAVEARLVSDVPLGVFLSGGLDSSAILAALSTLRDPREVQTFAIGFEDPSFDESRHARAVAQHFRTHHRERVLTAGDMLALIPKLGDLIDEPLADASIVPTHLLARFAREHVTVALGGDGGDELLAGYPTFHAERGARVWQSLPGSLRRASRAGVARRPVSTDNLAPGFIARSFVRGADYGEVLRHQVWLGSFDGPAMDRVLVPGLGPTAAGDDPLADVAAYAADTPHRDGTDRLLDFYARFYLADGVLVKVDRATMRVALEARAPFLDHDLVRFVTGLPSAWKLRGGTTKWLLRKAYRGILPPAILRRPKKGFGIPLAAWLKGPLQPLMADLLSAERLAAGGLFRPDEVQRLIHEHQAGADDHHKPLWTLMVWQMWQARTGATL